MNADRRYIGRICVELMKECNESGLISDTSHVALLEAIKHLRSSEHWQLQNQLKHEGKNESTDKQIAICRVALPALESAVSAIEADDFMGVIEHLTLAITTDGTTPQTRVKKSLAKRRKVK